jgi:hypothetical protein
MGSLSLKLEPSHFKDRKIRVRCTATIHTLYNETSEEFQGELPPRERDRVLSAASGFGARNGASACGRFTALMSGRTLDSSRGCVCLSVNVVGLNIHLSM